MNLVHALPTAVHAPVLTQDTAPSPTWKPLRLGVGWMVQAAAPDTYG
jgi:hypothetical protein